MSRVLAYLTRFFIIILGYAVASLAASAFLNIVFMAWAGFTAVEVPAMVMGSFMLSIPFVVVFVAYFAFAPAVPAIVLAEVLGKRDWLFYAIAGGIVAVAVLGYFWQASPGTRSTTTDPGFALSVIGAGMCGGIAYWLVTGRSAGAWRPERQNATSSAP